MEPLFFELTDILTRQSEIIKEQLKASAAQNLALRRFDTVSLAAAVTRMEELAVQMSTMDRQREKVQQELEEALHLPPETTLTRLMPKAPLELIFKLKELTRKLRKDLRQLDELNGFNSILTSRALEVNETLLEVLKSGGGKKTYQHSGELKPGDRPTTVLDKTV